MRIVDCMAFIKSRPNEKAFKDWTDAEILHQLVWAISNKAFLWSMDKAGNIDGIIVGRPYPETKVMHIIGVIANKQLLGQFLEWFKANYNGWTLEANRHGIKRAYKDVERLLSKLSVKE